MKERSKKEGNWKEEGGNKGTIRSTTSLAATAFPVLVPGPNTLSCKPLVVLKPVVGSQFQFEEFSQNQEM